MPNNAGKKMGMMQLGLLTVGALLLSGALIVKTKRDAVADVPVAVVQEIADEAPAAGDGDLPKRTFGDNAVPQAAIVAAEPGVSEGSEGSEGSGVPGGSEGVAPAPAEPAPEMPAADCSAYEGWVGKPLDRAAVEATGKPHRILKPGDMMTMDFNPERINVETDEKGEMVMRVFCG